MELALLLKGIAIGITVSAPLGPIGVLCIQRTINKGTLAGFISGVGAVIGDTLYAIIAGFGLTIVSDLLIEYQFLLRIIGGSFLIYFGYKIFMANPAKQLRAHSKKKNNPIGDLISVFFLTISNPLTIIVFTAAFAKFGFEQGESDNNSIGLLITGVFTGTVLWWFFLSNIVNIFRTKIRLRNLWWINKITGTLIVLFGLITIISLFFLKTI